MRAEGDHPPVYVAHGLHGTGRLDLASELERPYARGVGGFEVALLLPSLGGFLPSAGARVDRLGRPTDPGHIRKAPHARPATGADTRRSG